MNDTETFDDDPRPLLQLASTPEVLHEALTLLHAEAPRPLARAKHEALFRAAADRAHGRGRSAPRMVLAFAAACLVGAFASAQLISLLRPPEFTAAPDAVVSLDGRTLTITQGHVDLHPRRALTVRAGSLELSLQRGRAAMDVTSEGVSVHVEEGEAVVREGEATHHMHAGQALTTVPPPPVQLELPEARTDSCAPGAADCLSALAASDGLEAETAVYELALAAHERGDTTEAIARFSEHQRRFPDGVLAPEASIGLMLGHLSQRDTAAASAEARRFIARFPSDPRLERVRALAR